MFQSSTAAESRGGGCACCSRVTLNCVCGDCVTSRLGSLKERVTNLRQRLLEVQESCQPLLDLQFQQEKQQHDLHILRSRAAEARSAAARTQRQLQVVQARAPTEQDKSSYFRNKGAISSAIFELTTFLEKEKQEAAARHRALEEVHRRCLADQEARRCRALLDTINTVPALVPPRSLETIVNSTPRGLPPDRLFQQCKGDTASALYLSDALSHLNLFIRTLGAVFNLPVAYHSEFLGTHSLIWTPENFWALDSAPPQQALSLRLRGSSNTQECDRRMASWEASALATQRCAAIALSEFPQVRMTHNALVSPMEWFIEVCSVLLEGSNSAGAAAMRDATCRLPLGPTRKFSTQQYGGPLEDVDLLDEQDEDSDEWELMTPTAHHHDEASSLPDSIASSLNSVVDRIRRLTSSYQT